MAFLKRIKFSSRKDVKCDMQNNIEQLEEREVELEENSKWRLPCVAT
jgi:hypothetical protein